MSRITDQREYWSRVAGEKEFRHPFNAQLLGRYVSTDERVLDLGCGAGRVTAELAEHGWTNVVGADTARGMVALGQERHPELDIWLLEPGPLPFADSEFGAVLLFSVLTCIPGDQDEEDLMREVVRVLAPGGILYLSDLLMQPDGRNQERYIEGEIEFGTRGVFSLPEGVVLRHFTEERIDELCAGLEKVQVDRVEIVTMNGNPAHAYQMLARKPGS